MIKPNHISLITVAYAFLVLSSIPVSAGTLANTRTKVDNWLAAQWGSVTNAQNTYFGTHGRYWQGLLTCTPGNYPAFTTGADGYTAQDNLSSKPNYESEAISDIFPGFVGVQIPAAFTCDQYQGPNGPGYVVTVYVRYNGVVYFRSQAVGLESFRTQPWNVYAPRTPP